MARLIPPPIRDAMFLGKDILQRTWIMFFEGLFRTVQDSKDSELLASSVDAGSIELASKVTSLEQQLALSLGSTQDYQRRIEELEQQIQLSCTLPQDYTRRLEELEQRISGVRDYRSYDADLTELLVKTAFNTKSGEDPERSVAHLMQSDSTDQAIADTGAAQVITFDTDVHHQGILRTSSSRFTITKKGSYLITFSGVTICGTAGKRIEVWLRLNGSDVAASNTVYTFKSANANTVIACSYIEHLDVDDYFEFWTWGDDTGAKWDATAAVAAPSVPRPACPSIIITCNYLSWD